MLTFQKEQKLLRRIGLGIITFVLSVSLIFGPSASYAQSFLINNLPQPGTMLNLSRAFVPVLVRGIKIYPDNNLKFDFILDSGSTESGLNESSLKQESTRLIKYFLAALTTPSKDLWVNLSPY